MYDGEQRMQEIIEAPQLTAVDKSKLYSDHATKSVSHIHKKMGVPDHHPSHEAPVQTTPLVPNEPVATISPAPTSPKHNFRRGTTKTQTHFFQIGTKVTWHE